MKYAEWNTAARRLAILQLLIEAGGEAALQALEWGLKQSSHRVGVDSNLVASDLRHLQKVLTVELDYPTSTTAYAKITKHGVQVARGTIAVEGVAQPDLGV